MTTQQQHEQANEPEGQFSDTDSAAGSDNYSSYTASLLSSIKRYPVEHGRRYAAYGDGNEPMPNDETELERLDIAHAMFLEIVDGKLFLAPLKTERSLRVLDIGTGTGIWSMEMGDAYPNAEVTGIDLSPVQPTWVPPNVTYQVDDIEQPWVFREKFDFIFSRYMALSIKDWPKLVSSIYDNLAPGAWAEFQDCDLTYYSKDGTLTNDHPVKRWCDQCLEASRMNGREPCPGLSLEKWVRDQGFINVKHHTFEVPIGPWSKEEKFKRIGAFNLLATMEGVEAFSLRLFTRTLGWSVEELQVLLAGVRKNMKDPRIHTQFDYHVVYGQKPEE